MKTQATQPHTRSERLTRRFGIVCGPLSLWADVLDTTPDAVLSAIERTSIRPIIDTGKSKTREKHARPTAPQLRHIAITTRDAARLLEAVTSTAPYESVTAPAR